MPRRLAAWVAGVWAGAVAALGFVAAPVLFAVLPRAEAGEVAAHLFRADAALGLALGAGLLVLTLNVARRAAAVGGSRFSVEMALVLVALGCIVGGHYALVPMLDAARGDRGRFALLHGVASVFFVIKLAAIAVVAWRLGGDRVRVELTAAAPTS
ncbi:MAG: DUF4149 domain-containing protein [Rhizobacter sp.]|nr:DUF4149 domain-containing protein [Rhizobacter sp.]